jgi:hypothetical protein
MFAFAKNLTAFKIFFYRFLLQVFLRLSQPFEVANLALRAIVFIQEIEANLICPNFNLFFWRAKQLN